MPQVPYNPVPQVQPTEQAIAPMREDTPIAAFGGATAQAVSGLGQEISRAGNELFGRAIALQDLNNRADADERVTNAAQRMGDRYEQFRSLEKKNAVDDYPNLQTDLEKIRVDGAQGANPYVQRLYNSESRSTMVRLLVQGGAHAGQESKNWQNAVSTSKHKQWMDDVLSNPDDSELFAGALNNATKGAIEDAARAGFQHDDDGTKLLIKQRQSEVWASKINGLATKNPSDAKDLLEGALSKGYISGQDYQRLLPKVDTMLHSVVSRNVSDAVNKGWAPYVTLDQASRATGVENALVDVVKRAQQNHPEMKFMIAPQGGTRTQEEQDKLYRQGRGAPGPVVTWTRYSEHLTGRAVDLMPLDAGTSSDKVRVAMAEAAKELGVNLADLPTLAAKDPGHFQLAKDFNTGDYKQADLPSLEDRQRAAEQFVTEKYNDPKMTFATRDRIRQDWGQIQTDQRHEQTQNFLQLSNFIHDNNIISKDLVLNNPMLSEAYFRLDEPHKQRVDKLIGALAKEPTQDTPEKTVAAQKILNMSTEIGGKRAAFLNIDPAELLDKGIISTNGMKAIYSKQRQINEGVARDSRHLTHAMQLSRDYLKAAQITSGSDEEVQFTGGMNQWLTDYEQQKKHFPPDQEVRDKAQSLAAYTGMLWWGKYGFQPSDDFTKEFTPLFKKAPANTSHRDPSLEDIARAYEYSLSHPDWKKDIGG